MASENGIHSNMTMNEERHSPTDNHRESTEHHNGHHSVESDDYDSEDSMEAPLDFSMKTVTPRQNRGSENSHNGLLRRQSSGIDSQEFDRFRSKSGERDGDSSSSSSSQDPIGEPKTITPSSISFSGEAFASLGMVPGLKAAGIVPNANFLASLPNMSAFYDPRGKHQFNNKSARPFKCYPKDSTMSLPLAYYGVPGCLPLPNVDQNTIANINKTTEELYDMYKQQLVKIHNLESKKRHRGAGLPLGVSSLSHSSSPTSPSPPPLAVDTSGRAVASTSPSDYPKTASPASDSSTPSRGRKRAKSLPDEQKDQAYWERRRKNNEAAKRSRDARRAKEDEIAIRAALLEQENLKLRVEVASLKNETAKLRCMLFNGN